MTNDARKRILWRIVALLVLAALLMITLITVSKGANSVFGLFGDSTMDVVLDENFDVEGVSSVELDMGSLNVDIVSTREDQVRLVLESNMPPDKRAELVVERKGNTFTVEQIQRVRIGLFLNVRERLTLYLPAEYEEMFSIALRSGNVTMTEARTFSKLAIALTSGNVELGDILAGEYEVKASSGNVTLGSWTGSGSVHVSSGNVRAQSLSGDRHEIKTTSGTVRIESITGDVQLSVISGSLRVEHFEGRGKFTSTSGSLRVGIDRFTGDIDLHCVSGTIRASVPSDAAFRFEGESFSGSIHTDFPATKEGRRATATVGNSPEYSLRCHTTSGSIKVEN